MQEHRKPYRLVVCCRGYRAGRKYKRHTEIVPTGYAFMGWTPVQSYQEARLPSDGSFLYPGIVEVRRAAMEYLARPEVHQVQVKTNQDASIYIWNKHADGRITGYLTKD
jgi:hypothetical protein